MVALPKTYLRPISSAVVSQSQTLAAQNSTPVAFLPQVRSFQTSPVTRDIDSAAKFIGAGAATVGVAGSGEFLHLSTSVGTTHTLFRSHSPLAHTLNTSEIRSRDGRFHQGLQKSCTWGTHTSTWLLIYIHKMPREGLRFGGASRVWSTFNIPAGCRLSITRTRGQEISVCQNEFGYKHWYLSSPAIWVRCAGWILHPELNSD